MSDPEGTVSHEPVAVEELLDQLETLEATVDAPEERAEVRETMKLARRLPVGTAVSRRIERYTTRDVAESVVGSVLLSLPLLVEDGVYDIADHMATTFVAGVPIFFLINLGFIVTVTAGLLYYAEFRNVAVVDPVFGVVPRRLLGVLIVSFLVSTLMMTMWGRVEGWDDPWVALCRVSVIWAAAAFGGAIGDILPGEGSGREVGRELLER